MDVGAGRVRQNAIYRAGAFGHAPSVPTGPAELERRAQQAMSRRAWAYVGGGAGAGVSMRRNREAFDRWQIVPRMLSGITRRDLSTTILGTQLPAPVLVAPVGAAALVRADSDVLIAEGAAANGIPYVFSCQGCNPMEQTAAAMGSTPFWYQLYWSTDEKLVDSMIGRAEACGAQALVVTLDTTMLGWRPQDLDLGSLPFSAGLGIAQYTSDPRFREIVRERLAAATSAATSAGPPAAGPRPGPGALRTLVSMARAHPGRFVDNLRSPEPRMAVETFLDIYSNPGLAWTQLAGLRKRTSLPVLVKGILHPDDAVRALESGVDGVIVSNHGGRQVDASIAALDALGPVRAAVGPEATVLFDSGIRTGSDVLLALALGADACLIGRPHVYGLALDGADGVRQVLANIVAELELTMGLAGAADIAAIAPPFVRPRP